VDNDIRGDGSPGVFRSIGAWISRRREIRPQTSGTPVRPSTELIDVVTVPSCRSRSPAGGRSGRAGGRRRRRAHTLRQLLSTDEFREQHGTVIARPLPSAPLGADVRFEHPRLDAPQPSSGGRLGQPAAQEVLTESGERLRSGGAGRQVGEILRSGVRYDVAG